MPVKDHSLDQSSFSVNICFEKSPELFDYLHLEPFSGIVRFKIVKRLDIVEGLLTISVRVACGTDGAKRSGLFLPCIRIRHRSDDEKGA
jgi:hypothetical protein